ncbi:MAG: sugar ABC transporter permease, partial [Anaerolineae bacterium]
MAQASRERWIAFLMVLPSILLIAVFVYGFIGWTATVSLSNWDGVTPDYSLAGLDNFQRLFGGGSIEARRFSIDLWNTFFFTLFFLVGCVVFGLLLAILLD